MAEQEIVKQSQLGVPIGNKTILGQLTSYKDGTAKWTYAKDINPLQAGFGDRSTFTLSKKPDGTWAWSPTTSTSISNLAQRENLTTDEVTKSLYVKSENFPTSQTQAVLNAGNANNLGLSTASRLGVPGAKGTSTVTGTLPSQVSGAFAGQAGATPVPDPENPDAAQQEGATADQVKGDLGQFDAAKLGQAITDGGIRASYGGGKNGGYYIYPIDMKAKQDKIKFTMYRYAPKKVDVSNISASTQNIFSGPNTKGSSMGTVYLPIQPSIADSNAVTWGEDPLNSLEALGATAAYGAIQGGGKALGEAGEGVANLIAGDNNNIKAALMSSAAGAAVNKSFLTRATGGIINPNLELLFGGPSLRSFNFTFDMSARSEDEAKEIRRIIRFFKQGMSVKRSASFLFLKTPNVFDIEYQFETSPHTWLNKFKTCALTNCIVNYTPAGNYSTYADGAMTQYNMTLTFGEIDPIYDDDYGTADNTQNIGY